MNQIPYEQLARSIINHSVGDFDCATLARAVLSLSGEHTNHQELLSQCHLHCHTLLEEGLIEQVGKDRYLKK